MTHSHTNTHTRTKHSVAKQEVAARQAAFLYLPRYQNTLWAAPTLSPVASELWRESRAAARVAVGQTQLHCRGRHMQIHFFIDPSLNDVLSGSSHLSVVLKLFHITCMLISHSRHQAASEDWFKKQTRLTNSMFSPAITNSSGLQLPAKKWYFDGHWTCLEGESFHFMGSWKLKK